MPSFQTRLKITAAFALALCAVVNLIVAACAAQAIAGTHGPWIGPGIAKPDAPYAVVALSPSACDGADVVRIVDLDLVVGTTIGGYVPEGVELRDLVWQAVKAGDKSGVEYGPLRHNGVQECIVRAVSI